MRVLQTGTTIVCKQALPCKHGSGAHPVCGRRTLVLLTSALNAVGKANPPAHRLCPLALRVQCLTRAVLSGLDLLQVLSEALVFLAQVVEEFGLASLPVKNLLDWSKEDLQSANAAVRNAVVQLLGVMHR